MEGQEPDSLTLLFYYHRVAGWHPAWLTSTCVLHTHGEDARNQKRQPLTCPLSASRCQVRLASWNRLQSIPASHPSWGHRPCCFPTPALRKKHLLPLSFCFLESCAPGKAYIFVSSGLTGSFTPPWKIFCPVCWRFSDLLSACGHNRKNCLSLHHHCLCPGSLRLLAKGFWMLQPSSRASSSLRRLQLLVFPQLVENRVNWAEKNLEAEFGI